MTKTNKTYDKMMDALNRIDELASISAQDNEEGEAEQLQKDYNLVADFIGKHAHMKE